MWMQAREALALSDTRLLRVRSRVRADPRRRRSAAGDLDWLSLTVIAAAAARRLGGRRPATGQGRRVILQVAVRLSAGVGHYEPEPQFFCWRPG